nr:uncharacterized protein LOC119179019 [Rhipicephalus microplus]
MTFGVDSQEQQDPCCQTMHRKDELRSHGSDVRCNNPDKEPINSRRRHTGAIGHGDDVGMWPNPFTYGLQKGPQVREVRDEQDDFDILDVNVGSKADWLINATMASKQVSLKVDTGSQANLLPQSVFQSLKSKSRLRESSSVLRLYSGDAIKHIGFTTLQVVANSHTGYFDFFIVKKSTQAILGLSASEALGLVSRTVDVVNTRSTIQAMTEFPELFQGIGCLKRQYHMVLRGDATPVVQPVRRVPQALLQPLRKELDRMEHEGIVVKVSEPTDWVSPFVAARKKDGKLRVCIDPRCIKESLKREHYQMPKSEDIEAELAGAKFFSRLDAQSGFHQIPLDKATSKI